MNSISPTSTIPLRFRKSETGTEGGLCYPGKRSSVALDLHLRLDLRRSGKTWWEVAGGVVIEVERGQRIC
jgi:hypothetical protein